MDSLSVVVRLGAAIVLLFAGAQKLASPRSFRQTLEALHVPFPHAAGVAVPVAELLAAAGLLAFPGSLVTAALVVGLGAAFAGAAGLALARRQDIHCACYGPVGGGDLGMRHVLALPLWAAVAVVSLRTPPANTAGIGWVAAVGCAVSLALAARVLIPFSLQNRAYLQTFEGPS